ncbi:serine protease, S1-C subfamily, contains C-terminal PDZ domain [Hathewaya proteolytica DSM 3090]|uniref:Serine protease, S1-C subfamily, contains C-terminal PDZ domain n=1 Tax=Hathewaya proteolytica DSM 3090 TaxID=1121331 RepID=A0A1M6MAP2_9CLOT|nr:PDZ domain-containing protein [Hathewaya proteolytica]SHJ80373.1 serine protease, S1-C subfamily, contains C-terminal PDZ domain [Hathewaya proteolytica DSM 3090]
MKEKSDALTNTNANNDNLDVSAIKFRKNEFKSYMRLWVVGILFLSVTIVCAFLFYRSHTKNYEVAKSVILKEKSGSLYADITKIESSNVSISNCVVVCADDYKDIGLILNNNEYVVTNLKLISKAKNIFVKLPGGGILKGDMIDSDKHRGLAYLKMIPYLSGEEENLEDLDPKQYIHYSQLLDLNKRTFIEKKLDRRNIMIGGQDVYCITANVEERNITSAEEYYLRGIVLCNQYGNVLGVDFINGLEMKPDDIYSFVDMDFIGQAVKRVSDDAYMMMKKLGMEVSSATNKDKFVGIYVKNIEDKSPMCVSGVFPTDIITSLQDNNILSMEQFISLLGMYKNNNKLRIKVLRNDQVIQKTVIVNSN